MSHNLYGVTTDEVAAELPALFPNGFSPSTTPTDTVVLEFIKTADTVVSLRIQEITGVAPAETDESAILARRYILNYAKAQVLRIVYMRDPLAADAAARPYEAAMATIYTTLDTLAPILTGEPATQVRGSMPDRQMLIPDAALGEGARGGSAARLF